MYHRFAPLAVLLIPGIAIAADPSADKPIIGPPPAWVRSSELPADSGKTDERAVRLLLADQQVLLKPSGSEAYSETVLRVQTAQGLSALGNITFPWKPDRGTLTVHKLRILRDGKTIDLLGKGQGFTVLRRENNLEYAMLDGILTAVVQPEGLQVGDVLDMAYTVTSSDPVLAGNSEGLLFAGPGARADHIKLRALWGAGLPVRWRAGEGFPAVREHKAGGMSEIALALDNIEPVIPPKGAPLRFALTRLVEASTLKSWNDLSALFAPLYAKAATLKADSPLKAEVDRIAAATKDPARRAEAALALVQDKVRYVFLGMNDGSLVPADADLSWQRRFADCKGKTALLIALLHGLGIDAEPALVSTGLGDGMDARLPMMGLFDHVIVRATIGGKVYWLDGTRMGDVRLADIRVPLFRFALPLRTPGTGLEPLVVPVPDKPLAEYSFKVDMSGGITQPFPFHVEEVTRGDGALSAHMALDNLAPDVRQQTLRDYFAGQYDEVEPKTFAASWDPATGEEKLVMDGLAKHDWKWGYEADRSGIGWNADFARTEGAHRDAPFAVDYPDYIRVRETILLPSGGKGFVAQAPDVDRTIAGVEYHRKTKLEGATYSMELTRRAVAREFPAADAPAAQQALRELAKQQALLGVTDNYIATSQERAAWLTTAPTTALEYFRRADARAEKNDLAGARDDFSKAIALDSSYGWAFLRRGNLLWQMGKPEDALPDLQKAVALMPASGPAHSALGRLLGQMERFEEGAAELDRAVLLTPGDSKALMGRARINFQLDRLDAALADGAAAIKQNPAELMAYQARMSVFKRRNEPDKEVAEGQAAVAANPKSDMAHILLAVAYMQMKRPADGMAEFDKAIAIKPTSYAYLTRANNRAPEDSTGRRADIAAALKLDPTDEVAHQMAIALELRAKKYPAAIAAANKALSQWPKDAGALVNRGIAYAQIGRATEAEKDFAAARLAAGSDAVRLNSLCWSKATFNVALDSALADCDASLRVAPNFPNTLDSRAFVLFRMGRYPDALRGYDEVLKLRPKSAASLYVRGLIERRLGKAVEGDADIKAAKAIESGVDQEFADYGVTG